MSRRRSGLLFTVAAIALGTIAACGRSDDPRSHPEIRLTVPPDTPAAAYIEIAGLSPRDLNDVRAAAANDEGWRMLLRVSVDLTGGDQPAMVGAYSIQDGAVRFTPGFPLDAGRPYKVVFDRSRLPSAAGSTSAPLVAVVSLPKPADAPSTVVSHIYPTSDVVPANQLRLYIHFSAPMSRRSGLDFVHLVDEHGKEIEGPFLPLDTDLWNDDRTRFTVFFDPGRVKSDLLPQREMGPSLEAGHRYTLVVDAAWPDAKGQRLNESFRRTFRVGPVDERPLDPKTWRIAAPAATTRDPVVVTFPSPLDHGLLQRAVGVARNDKLVEGDTQVDGNETRWRFSPREAWQPGQYHLVALSILEDLAGNRIGQAFEVDRFEEVDRTAEPERFTVAFRIGTEKLRN